MAGNARRAHAELGLVLNTCLDIKIQSTLSKKSIFGCGHAKCPFKSDVCLIYSEIKRIKRGTDQL